MYIADKITQVITNFEPRVQLQTVTVDPVPDGYGYEVSIKYTVNNILGSLEINTFLTRIR
jgi:predicted component of type VI protein secretion system